MVQRLAESRFFMSKFSSNKLLENGQYLLNKMVMLL